ncbi:MAG: alpha-amylase family glycosyl hydrolase [Lautropia sp.]|nr:alpha-amylase family glycosyl hydrolase [Lautropia sp.]
MPHWAEQTIWWHLYPLGFTGAPVRPAHEHERAMVPRLNRLLPWLDYLQELGANGLALGPVFESDSHGYDTTNFFRVDPRLGSQSDFDRLMHACDERGIAVMLDGVFNHVSHRHPLFRSALAGDPVASRYFQIRHGLGTAGGHSQADRTAGDASHQGGADENTHGPLPGGDHLQASASNRPTGNEAAQRAMRELAEDSSGPRHRGGITPRAGTPSYICFEGHHQLPTLNHAAEEVLQLVTRVMHHWLDRGARAWRLDAAHAVPPAFWRRLLLTVRQRHPRCWFVGEIILGDFIEQVRNSSIDSATQYHLWHSARHSLQHADFGDLERCLDRHNRMLREFTPLTFLGNHDVVRLASQIGAAKAALAFALQMTVGGSPSIYYGDEQTLDGTKLSGDALDDELRPPYPASPDALPKRGRWMYMLLQRLIQLRHAHPWLARANTRVQWRHDRGIGYRVHDGDGRSLVVSLLLDPKPHARIVHDGVTILDIDPPST